MIKSQLESLILLRNKEIKEWFSQAYSKLQPNVYSSVDIRHSGFKLAPVDTNLFPAGFNNLDEQSLKIASITFKKFINQYYDKCKRILVITESHTRNLHYLDNLIAISKIITDAGYTVILGNFDIAEDLNLVSATKQNVFIKKITIIDKQYDLILLNNDLTDIVPEILTNSTKIILPNPQLGWHSRRKSKHFTQYNILVEKFCKLFSIDPFFITTYHRKYHLANFKDQDSIEEIAQIVEETLAFLKVQYQNYNIKDDPFVFIKSDMGTYGMGMMTAKSKDDVLKINKSIKNKMNIIKNGVVNDKIIIQEGVLTIEKFNDSFSEKMIYCIAGKSIAIINRFNNLKNNDSNLNARGMFFAMNDSYQYNSYSLIAELATLASIYE